MEQLELRFKEQSRDVFRILQNIQYGYPKKAQRFWSCWLFSQKAFTSDAWQGSENASAISI